VVFVRNGETKNATVTVAERPQDLAFNRGGGKPEGEPAQTAALGMKVTDLTPEIADQLGIEAGMPGAVVVDLEPGSPAERAGVMVGDIVFRVNRRPVNNAGDFAAIAQAAPGDLLLQVRRQSGSLFILVKRP
jgi:serine protease Do